MSTLAFVFLAQLFLQPAAGAPLQLCLAVESDLERLACYDSLAKAQATAHVKEDSAVDRGDWIFKQDRDAMTDEAEGLLLLMDEDGKASLVIKCRGKELSAYVTWNAFLTNEDRHPVESRFGDSPPSTDSWALSTDNTATFFPGAPQGAVIRLAMVRKFVARTIPFQESPITAVFHLDGIKAGLEGLEGTCGLRLHV